MKRIFVVFSAILMAALGLTGAVALHSKSEATIHPHTAVQSRPVMIELDAVETCPRESTTAFPMPEASIRTSPATVKPAAASAGVSDIDSIVASMRLLFR